MLDKEDCTKMHVANPVLSLSPLANILCFFIGPLGSLCLRETKLV